MWNVVGGSLITMGSEIWGVEGHGGRVRVEDVGSVLSTYVRPRFFQGDLAR